MIENRQKGPNLYLKVLGYSTPVLALAALLTYGYITVYYSGYLRAFNIDIRYIDFFPKMVDVTIWGVVVCISLSLFTVILVLSLYASTVLGNRIRDVLVAKHKMLRWLKSDDGTTSRHVAADTIMVGLLIMAFGLVFYAADKQGYEMGKSQTKFTIAADEQDKNNLKVLIYQNGNVGTFEQYDKVLKRFSDSYSVESVAGKVFRSAYRVR